jgi:hypothetical protein
MYKLPQAGFIANTRQQAHTLQPGAIQPVPKHLFSFETTPDPSLFALLWMILVSSTFVRNMRT